jgi:hypothetical protein
MFKRIAMLALLAVSLVSARTYSFAISDPAQAGTAQLKPGQYRLRLDGSQVVLLDKTGHQIDTAARVEESEGKFDQTSVTTTRVDGTVRIESVELGGSHTKVVFQQADTAHSGNEPSMQQP